METESVDFAGYRFETENDGSLDQIESFDLTATTAQLSQSFGTSYSEITNQMLKRRGHKGLDKHAAMVHPMFLTWRLDPDDSLSDYTLTVVSNPSLDRREEREFEESEEEVESPRKASLLPAKKYFVHRTQLAVGPRRSEYFAKLFKAKSKRLAKATRIELRPSAAAAFPIMLDFIYSPVGTPADVTTDSAVALRHLATCFGVRELFESVTDFIKKDLTPETAPTYLLESENFHHEKLASVALEICAANFESIKFSRIVTLPPELFDSVIASASFDCTSEVLSSRVASYCRCRPGSVDVQTLKSLTQKMTKIAPEESLFFLHLISEIESDEDSLANRSRGDSLYQRCLDASTDIVRLAVASSSNGHSGPQNLRRTIDTRPRRNAVKEYYTLSATMKVDLLENALLGSPTPAEVTALENARKETKKKQATHSAKQLHQMEAEMERIRRRYEKKLASYEARIEAQEQELSAYATELSRFVRVPNEHRLTPLMSEYTYQQKPEYDEYGESIYGEIPPSTLPRFGHQTRDGWVMLEERYRRDGRRDPRLWPMYYYCTEE